MAMEKDGAECALISLQEAIAYMERHSTLMVQLNALLHVLIQIKNLQQKMNWIQKLTNLKNQLDLCNSEKIFNKKITN